MRNIDIYFDCIEKNGKIGMAVVAYKKGDVLKPLFKNSSVKDDISEYNHYNRTLEGLEFAIQKLYDWLQTNNFPEVKATLINQNEYIFKWLQTNKFGIQYEQNYARILEEIAKVVDCVNFEFKVIKGKDNKAKSLFKSLVVEDTSSKLDFSALKGKLERAEIKRVANGSNVTNISNFKL